MGQQHLWGEGGSLTLTSACRAGILDPTWAVTGAKPPVTGANPPIEAGFELGLMVGGGSKIAYRLPIVLTSAVTTPLRPPHNAW